MSKNLLITEIKRIVRDIINENEIKATRSDALQYLSDLYKELNGFRPDISMYNDLSNEELWKEIQKLQELIKQQTEHEQNQENINIEKFEKKIEDLIKIGAKDRETALRWLFDPEEQQDVDGFFYKMGLPMYSVKGKELYKELEKILWQKNQQKTQEKF